MWPCHKLATCPVCHTALVVHFALMLIHNLTKPVALNWTLAGSLTDFRAQGLRLLRGIRTPAIQNVSHQNVRDAPQTRDNCLSTWPPGPLQPEVRERLWATLPGHSSEHPTPPHPNLNPRPSAPSNPVCSGLWWSREAAVCFSSSPSE